LPLSTPEASEAPDETAYPRLPAARDRWILERRGPRIPVDSSRPIGVFLEDELAETGVVAPVVTVLIANRECPWRCLMCDLWRHTTEGPVPRGAVAAQIRVALAEFPDARRAKLYNAGSFFDPRAFPREDLAGIAIAVNGFHRVIVECHPALVGEPCLRFSEELGGALELAMGLETIHPRALDALNKRMTTDDFRRAADRLASWNIPFRAFVLLGLPGVAREDAVEWAIRSAAFAFDTGAESVAIIPTRAGNGAMDALAGRGDFLPPTLTDLERALAGAIHGKTGTGRVFADLWDLGRFSACGECFGDRRARLEIMNRTQTVPALLLSPCATCGRSA